MCVCVCACVKREWETEECLCAFETKKVEIEKGVCVFQPKANREQKIPIWRVNLFYEVLPNTFGLYFIEHKFC